MPMAFSGKFVKVLAKMCLLSLILIIVTNVGYAILSSSVVERSAVNRLVAGSNPAWGVYTISDAVMEF